MKGMTGYSNIDYESENLKVNINAKSLNSRFLELKIVTNIPSLEKEIRDILRTKFRRGKIEITVNVLIKSNSEYNIIVDEGLAKSYFLSVKKLSNSLGLLPDIEISDIIDKFGVIKIGEPRFSKESKKTVIALIKESTNNLAKQREQEGQKIKKDIENFISIISEKIELIEKKIPELNKLIELKLSEKVQKYLLPYSNNKEDQMLYMHAYLLKIDTNEEIVRIKMHLEDLKELISQNGEIGKKGEFLMQELLRECNTIASKSFSYEISSAIVEIKTCIEKIREHFQNIE